MTLLSTTNLTGSSVSLTGITSGYVNLLVFVSFFTFSGSTTLQMRVNGSTFFEYGNVLASTSTVSTSLSTSVNVSATNSSVANGFAVIDIPNYSNGSAPKIFKINSVTNWTVGANFNQMNNVGSYIDGGLSSAINSISLFPASGTFTAGQALLYGVK
jgi:hypothetical protein